jgi:hypothetical protein
MATLTDILSPHDSWKVQDATKIQTFMRCPRRYFYSYVLGWRLDQPAIDLIFGSAWHVAMEVFYSEGFSAATVKKAYEAFLATFRKDFPATLDETNMTVKTPANALRALAHYVIHYENDLARFDVIEIEVAGAALLNEEQALHFKIDLVLRDKQTGGVLGMEHKTTGSLGGRWADQWRQKFQLGVYSHVLYALYDEEEFQGILVNGVQITNPPRVKADGTPYANARDIEFMRVPIRLTPERMADWADQADYHTADIAANFVALEGCSPDDLTMRAFQKRTEACGDYRGCPYINHCTAHTNPLARCEKPPMGFKQDFWDPRKAEETAGRVVTV